MKNHDFATLVARLKASWTELYEDDNDPYGPVNMAHLLTDEDQEQFCWDLADEIEVELLKRLPPFFAIDAATLTYNVAEYGRFEGSDEWVVCDWAWTGKDPNELAEWFADLEDEYRERGCPGVWTERGLEVAGCLFEIQIDTGSQPLPVADPLDPFGDD